MKKYFFGLLCLFGTVIIYAQGKAVDSTDIYIYNDLTKQQGEKLKQIELQWHKHMNSISDKRGYLIAISQQQMAVDSVLNPSQRKRYQHYKMMKDATGWIKQHVSLSKEQEEKMAHVCFTAYDKLEELSANHAIYNDDKKIQAGKLMTELSNNIRSILTPVQTKQLEENNRILSKK